MKADQGRPAGIKLAGVGYVLTISSPLAGSDRERFSGRRTELEPSPSSSSSNASPQSKLLKGHVKGAQPAFDLTLTNVDAPNLPPAGPAAASDLLPIAISLSSCVRFCYQLEQLRSRRGSSLLQPSARAQAIFKRLAPGHPSSDLYGSCKKSKDNRLDQVASKAL